MSWPGRYNSTRGKQTRIRMLRKILVDSGGRIKFDILKNRLTVQGYPHLIEKLEAMGFFVDNEGYVREGFNSTSDS